ncbi:MAG: eukaryotic translation initiation factor EIF4E family protein [archaeon]|nr:eukaryotic translation initiation factor EIF4E family protein [archaeon]
MESKPLKELSNKWSFWYISRNENVHHLSYKTRAMEVNSFNTMEDFFKTYMFLRPINEIERNNEIGLFKNGYQPLWESCNEGGIWFCRFSLAKDQKTVNLYWEKVIFFLVSEKFEEPNILGAVLSIRGRETIIEVWFNYFGRESIKNKIGDKFRKLFSSEESSNFYFKDIQKSLNDRSTLRGAETHVYNPRKFTYG